MLKRAIQLSTDVRQALLQKRAVVALESTIISHGMPFPQNMEMAREVEEIIRQHDAVPATVAILSGQIHVGLTRDQLNHLATIGPEATKCATRDLGIAIEKRLDAATTVSSTMYVDKRHYHKR